MILVLALPHASFAQSALTDDADTQNGNTANLSLNSASNGTLPIAFVPNAGQAEARVRYSARTAGAAFYFTSGGPVFAFTKGGKGHAIQLTFPGANPSAEPTGARRGTGTVNYLTGRDASRWRTVLPAYGEIVYQDLWPGIDLAFRGERGGLKYEFRLAPGANAKDIRLAYRGVERLSVGDDGDLRIHTALGVLHDSRPVSFQEVGGERVPVTSRFTIAGQSYGFLTGDYDRSRPLVIDPGLDYSTYLGGGGSERGWDIAVDASGNAYVTGDIFQSTNFPVTLGAFDAAFTGSDYETFVTKLDPSGNLVYSTFLGGSGGEGGRGIAVDGSGCAYVIGATDSPDFPVTAGAFQTTLPGGGLFVTKLNPTGSALVYSTFLGAGGGLFGGTFGHYIVVDAAGNAYVTGTASPDFPTTPGAFDRTGQHGAGFVAKLNQAGSALFYSTFLAGTGNFNFPLALAVDSSGSAYVTGITDSTDFPTTPGAFDNTRNGNGPHDAFVTKLNPTGTALEYSTYLGGEFDDEANAIAVDASGSAYVTGSTRSRDFPTTPCALSRTRGGALDAFVTKLNPTGTALEYSTYLGGAMNIPGPSGSVTITGEIGYGIAVDASGGGVVTGVSSSPDFPVTPDAFDRTVNAGDAFVTRLSASGGFITYSTFLGGSDSEQSLDIALDSTGAAYVTGSTSSPDFPVTPGAFDVTYGGFPRDVFVTKMTLPPLPAELAAIPTTFQLTPPSAQTPAGTSATLTATVGNTLGDPLPNVFVRFNVTGSRVTSGSCTTGPDGRCDFSYQGPSFNGSDTINGFVDADNDGLKDTCELSATATNTWVGNGPPAVTDPGTQTNSEGDAVSLAVVASDPDGDSLTFTATGLPAGLTIDQTTGRISGTIDFNAGGMYDEDGNLFPERAYSVTVTASDGLGSRGVTFGWTVINVNGAPVAQPADATTGEDASVQIALAATDPDGDALTYTVADAPAHGTVTLSGVVATYTPAPDYNGPDTFSFRAADGTNYGNVATVSINVSPVNDAPTALDGAATLDEDAQVEILLAAADVDSAALVFVLVSQPVNGTLSLAGDRVVYTPYPDFYGADNFTFIVNDGTADSNVATVAFAVAPVADAPFLATVGNQLVAEGAQLSFELSASDPDGGQLTFGATGLAAGATLDPTTGAFSWTPTNEQAGVYTVTFTVTDPTNRSASETLTITVSDVSSNLGPVCSAAYPGVVEIWQPNHRQQSVSIFGVTDPDGDPLTINVRRIVQDEPTNAEGDGNTSVDGGGLGTPSAWVRAERSGAKKAAGNGRVYEIFFDASDGRGKSCTGSVKVGVPHDQGKSPAVDDGRRYDSTVAGGPCLNCYQ